MDKIQAAERKLAGVCLLCDHPVATTVRNYIKSLGRTGTDDEYVLYDAKYLCETHWDGGTLNLGYVYEKY